ncbi:MAG: peptidoglycan D,D-transpeptidase FtsI family protein [Phycisphaerales bacterium]
MRRSVVESDRISIVATLMVGAVLLAMLVVVARVAQLQTRPSRRLVDNTPSSTSIRHEIARRGDLLDRRGRVLATSRIGYRLFVDPGIVEDVDTLAIELGRLLGVNPVDLDRKIQERYDTRYVRLVPLLSEAQTVAIESCRIRGVGLEPVLVRQRPYSDLAAPLIGHVGADHKGLSGVEYAIDGRLTGDPGELRYLRDVRRRAMWVEPVGYRPARDGHDVRLSIDIELQRIAEEELDAIVAKHNAGGGRLLVMDPRTGEILAAADTLRSRPGFDDYALDPGRSLNPALGRPRWITDPYEPGSTFKPFVWAAATRLQLAQPEEVFETYHGVFRTSKGRRIRDSHPYEELSWDMVLVKSSNIGMAQVAERMTHAQMQQVVNEFGFGRPTGVGLPGETDGIVTPPAKWNHYSQTSVSMGHEIAVTPIQMIRAFSAFAGDGRLPLPTLFAVDSPATERNPEPLRAIVEQRSLPESIAYQTRLVLRRVMLEGTGRAANEGARYQMFGKSGTAQLPNRKAGGYHEDRYVVSFIAGAPLERPRLVALCVVEDPDKSRGYHGGGAVAGPVVRNVLNRSLDYLGVEPDVENETTELATADP